ncbi:MAG: ABC transporter ATP-binding protein [Thiocapsa sp.]|uniref:ABC transporter ATP-binding protein n=1 Tax=Thiocapsa sp. TaxID=2024551 RepID=UPI001BD11D04|nr:ABC transporter ATP-binding protein [Thiocapsa sp.]QVL50044.1 MAG: ABC transporter ATP-binding protein [Thiocapsa sp.]
MILRKLMEPVELLRRVFPLLWRSARGWTLVSTGLILLEVALGLAVLYLIKGLVDRITGLPADGAELAVDLQPLLLYLGLTGLCTLAYVAARALAGLARETQGMLVADFLDREIHDRAIRADLAFYESPRYFDTLRRAQQFGSQRPAQVVGNLLMLLKNGLMMAGVVLLVMSVDVWLLPLLLIATLPALLVSLRFTRRLYEWRHKRTEMERRAGYLGWLMTSDHHAKELRLNQLGAYLRDRYAELRGLIRREHLGITRHRTQLELAVAALATLAFFGALAYLTVQTADGRNTVGDLALFLLVFQRAQSMGQEVVRQISTLYEDHLYLGVLFEFLDIRPGIQDLENPLPLPNPMHEGIHLDGVSFRYPGTDAWVLKDLEMRIRPGQVVALVGANGSGKTSLIKLLCRLYDPTEGSIRVDGEDARSFAVDDYRALFSVIFQDYARYVESVRENIRFGDIRLPADSPEVERAAIQAGADAFIRRLPAGYDTQLSRMFEQGHEISVGQWQKLALARAFLHRSKVVILDEPTSALDPNAEFELFRDFRSRIEGRAALIISHRLSTIRMADIIYVLDGGMIREHGTHDELIAKRGIYTELFERQAYFYREHVTP